MTFDEEIRERVRRLKIIWRKCNRDQSRFRYYPYLEGVYQLYADIKSRDVVRPAVRTITQFSKINAKNHPVRVLLDASCNADGKTKSRGVRALRFAWLERRHWRSLRRFLQRNGGIAGAAAGFSENRQWKRLRPACAIPSAPNIMVSLSRKARAQALAHIASRVAGN